MEIIDENKVSTSDDPIVPIDFSPNKGQKKGSTFRLRWIHIFLASFLVVSGTTVWFIVTAKSVFIELDPITANIQIDGGLAVKMGQRYLVREGVYDLALSNEGYHALSTNLFVTEQQSQTHPIKLQKLPGLITIEVLGIEGSRVQVDSVDIGETPLVDVEIEAGDHQLVITLDRYQPTQSLLLDLQAT